MLKLAKLSELFVRDVKVVLGDRSFNTIYLVVINPGIGYPTYWFRHLVLSTIVLGLTASGIANGDVEIRMLLSGSTIVLSMCTVVVLLSLIPDALAEYAIQRPGKHSQKECDEENRTVAQTEMYSEPLAESDCHSTTPGKLSTLENQHQCHFWRRCLHSSAQQGTGIPNTTQGNGTQSNTTPYMETNTLPPNKQSEKLHRRVGNDAIENAPGTKSPSGHVHSNSSPNLEERNPLSSAMPDSTTKVQKISLSSPLSPSQQVSETSAKLLSKACSSTETVTRDQKGSKNITSAEASKILALALAKLRKEEAEVHAHRENGVTRTHLNSSLKTTDGNLVRGSVHSAPGPLDIAATKQYVSLSPSHSRLNQSWSPSTLTKERETNDSCKMKESINGMENMNLHLPSSAKRMTERQNLQAQEEEYPVLSRKELVEFMEDMNEKLQLTWKGIAAEAMTFIACGTSFYAGYHIFHVISTPTHVLKGISMSIFSLFLCTSILCSGISRFHKIYLRKTGYSYNWTMFGALSAFVPVVVLTLYLYFADVATVQYIAGKLGFPSRSSVLKLEYFAFVCLLLFLLPLAVLGGIFAFQYGMYQRRRWTRGVELENEETELCEQSLRAINQQAIQKS